MAGRSLSFAIAISLAGAGLFLFSCSSKKKTLFTSLPADETGITFSNRIFENDSINILDNEYVYNGGGVAIADFNNDSLPDIYFTGNMVSNQLYLNRGEFRFEEVTTISKVSGEGKWCSGVAVVDINEDGLNDLYVCATINKNAGKRANLLYVNQGNDNKGVPVFKEMAAEYGIADTTHTTNAAFFDYDRDGDLDLYIMANEIAGNHFPNTYHPKVADGSAPGTDRLYRNDRSDSLKHAVFTDVSRQAGIVHEGYGLGLHIADINRDGWPDVYVTNDYITDDLLYINNRNGTFTDRGREYFKHTSFSAMGNDIADINNDGLQDIIAVDMLPEDNYRKKMMLNPNNYSSYLNTRQFDYAYQYVRNTLQLNRGNAPAGDSSERVLFADIAWLSNIAATDWSWAPIVADFDNDGFRDIIITNGFPKDLTDHDFMAYRQSFKNYAPKEMLLSEIPIVKLQNYAYHNNGDLTFSKVSDDWGIDAASFSNGGAYADLDNDGDLDYVVNNINDSAFVYRNNLLDVKSGKANWLRVELKGDGANGNALGALVSIRYGSNGQQVHEQTPYRGYLSTMETTIHFGLGGDSVVNKLVVKWPDGNEQFLENVRANQKLVILKETWVPVKENSVAPNRPLFTDVSGANGLKYQHVDKDYIDFNVQKLLPHKFSQYGPAMAAGDINNDGLEDLFIGGSFGNSGRFFIQDKKGQFVSKELEPGASMQTKPREDAGVLLFDADGDNDPDLYIAGGGFENAFGSSNYRDRFYVNDGKGNFRYDSAAIPVSLNSKSCVKAADYDNDGDLDLFVGGRVVPGHYPQALNSHIYRNDSQNGRCVFKDVTGEIAPVLSNGGLVCDMLWSDFDNDGWMDIVVVGEWMPVMTLKNKNGKFEKLVNGLESSKGWWNSLAAGDFDNDGDIDYVAGNLGLNSFYKASDAHPAKVYAGDFNGDGSYDAIPSLFLYDEKAQLQEFPAFGRDDMIKQMIGFRAKFTTYKKYATTPMSGILTADDFKKALQLEANYFASSYIQNKGNGQFELTALPIQAQLSPLFAMMAMDVNGDTHLDLVVTGNDYGTEIATGQYDALNGLVLKGDGTGKFTALESHAAGFYVPGDGKALVGLGTTNNRYLLLASQNNSNLKAFELSDKGHRFIQLQPQDRYMEIQFKNAGKRREEVYIGHSFYSQSGLCKLVNETVRSIVVMGKNNAKREIKL